jgi:para-nitrobenzyl esterase
LVFNNIELGKHWTGTGAEAIALAQRMSDAWINFARTGNPNHKNLPKWPAYSASNGATLIFDRQIKVLNNHDRELMLVIKSIP